MKNRTALWIVALIITLGSAVYQRWSGPTYPVREQVVLGGQAIHYKLARSHGGQTDHPVQITEVAPDITGTLEWKRFKTQDAWTAVELLRKDGALEGSLPGQPPAGKLEYRLSLKQGTETVSLPRAGSVVIRFRGEVPPGILIPHIIAIFGAMLLSTRTGLEALRARGPEEEAIRPLRQLTSWTIGLLLVGGLIFGPLVQLYAFGALWTGFPFGTDLTDNKTLVAFIAWLFALVAVLRCWSRPRVWVGIASFVTFAIFLVPHSMLGSELDYNRLDREKAARSF